MPHQQGVVFVEEPGLVGQILHEEFLGSGIAPLSREQAQPLKNAAAVGIHHKDGLARGI